MYVHTYVRMYVCMWSGDGGGGEWEEIVGWWNM